MLAQRSRFYWFAALLLLSSVNACSDAQNAPRPAGSMGGKDGVAGSAGGDAGLSGRADAGESGAASGGVAGDSVEGDAGATALAPIWNEHSQHLELICSGPFDDDRMMFRADRAELSAQELERLGQLRQVEVRDGPCGSDDTSCHVSITSDTGVLAEYAADACMHQYPALDYSSLRPLLDVVPCKFDEELPPALTASSSCWHGIPMAASETHRALELAEPGRSYHIELDHCAGTALDSVTLRVLGSDAQTPIATGAPVAIPGPDGACLALDVEVTEPTTADLVISTNGVDPYGFYYQFR